VNLRKSEPREAKGEKENLTIPFYPREEEEKKHPLPPRYK
jgi:hypothetical protein